MELWEAVESALTEDEQSVSEKSRVTTVSVSASVVAMKFIVLEHTVQIAVLDWNGGAALMDCSLLERTASQSLSYAGYNLIYRNENAGALVPLARKIVDRS